MVKKNNFLTLLFCLFGLAIFLLPLERLGSLAYSGVNIRLSQILVILIFVLYFVGGFIKRKLEIKVPKPLVFYIIFLIVGLLSLIGAEEKSRGIVVSIFLAFMILIPFVTVIIVDNKEKLSLVTRIFLFSAVVFSLFGIFQFLGDTIGIPSSITGLSDRYVKEVLGFPRIQSTFIEPLYFANYLIIPLIISLFLILRRKNKKKELYLLLGLFILFLATIILTFSKGALASLAVIFVGIALFQIRSVFSKENIPYLIITLAFVSTVSWGAVSAIQAQPDFEKFYEKATEVIMGGSITERQEAYMIAVEAYSAHPVLGIGVGNFGPYFAGYPTSPPDFGWPIANNEYLEILAETGIVGFIAFLLFLFSIFYYSFLAFQETGDGVLKALLLAFNFAFIGILIQYLSFSTLYIMHIWVLIGLILAIQEIIFKSNKDE